MARGWVIIALGLCGCLPDDTRPPAGRLDVTVSPDEAIASGIETADGWHINYDRFLITIGEVNLDGDNCSVYNEVDYLRLLSLGATGKKKLSTPYARGTCDFGFQMRPPTSEAVVGEGVTESDFLLVGVPSSDAYAEEAGAALFVSGTAVHGAIEKRFSWAFRRGYQYEGCELEGRAGVVLSGNDEHAVDITLRTSTLFLARPDDDDAELRFGPFAEADDVYGDANGEVTIEELAAEPFDAGSGHPGWSTLADYVYLGLVPQIPRYRVTGTCKIGPYVEDDEGP